MSSTQPLLGFILPILFVLLLAISYNDRVDGFNITSSTITHKKVNALGTDLELAVIDIEVDREIYYHMDIVCPNYTCPNLVPQGGIDCTCDYTDPLNCPKTPSNDPSCPPCPLHQQVYNGTILTECQPGYNWTTIQTDTNYDFTITSTLFLRLKADASICQGIRFYLSQQYGEVYMYTGSDPVNMTRFSLGNEMSIGVCPSDISIDPRKWTNNTYSIAIQPRGEKASFSFIAYSAEVPQVVTQPACTPQANHTCVNDGGIIDSSARTAYYSFIVDRPMNFSIGCPVITQNILIYLSFLTPFPSENDFSWMLSNVGSDIYLTLPFDSVSQPLYITIDNYFSTAYRCTFTSHASSILRPITDNHPLGAFYLLSQTSLLILPNQTSSFVSQYYYFSFPRQNANPLWPIPKVLKRDDNHVNFFENIDYDQYSFDNPPKSNSYQAAVILRKGSQQYFSFSTIQESQIYFFRNLVDYNGNPLDSNSIRFDLKNTTCNYTQLEYVKNQLDGLESRLFTSSGFQQVSNIRFAIDVLILDDSWIACGNQASSLLETVIENVESNSTVCPYSPLEPAYANDPCCNPSKEFFQCCVPHLQTVPTTTYLGLEKSKISDQCSSPECTESVLQDYFDCTMSIDDECALEYTSFSQYQLEIYTTLRNCKSVYVLPKCSNDSMCPNQYSCNLYGRTCEIPIDDQDNQYFNCVINNLTPRVNYYLQSRYNISYDITDPQFIPTLKQYFINTDCTYKTSLDLRKWFEYTTGPVPNGLSCYPSPHCYDASCQNTQDICFQKNSGYEFKNISYAPYCTNIGICSDSSCYYQFDDCATTCLARPQFCGFCTANGSNCYNFDTITSSSQCNTTDSVCVYQGYYYEGMDNQTCATTGVCTSSCGSECKGRYTGCVLPTIIEPMTCGASGGNWDLSILVCTLPLVTTEEQCMATPMAQWVDCGRKEVSECYYPGRLQSICYVNPIPCATQEECETTGGQCSDSYFFSQTNVPTYSIPYLGKCVRGHKYYETNFATPSCLYGVERDSPRGCFNITQPILTKNECLALGDEYEWWEMSLNKSQCLSQKGCQIIDDSPYNLPNNFRFNEMNQAQCESCQSQDTGVHSWTNMFTWTPGVWIPGVPVKPTWMSPFFIQQGETKPVLDHMLLSNVLDDAYATHISDLLRSTSLCRTERIEDNLYSIACSCSGPGGSQCFNSSSLILGQSSPCSKEESEYDFSFGKVFFSNSSVPQACTIVVYSQLSKQLFKSTQKETLSSNFVSYKKPESFAIYNGNDAVVGVILTDGIKIESLGVEKFTVCFTTNDKFGSTSDYPIFDVIELPEGGSLNLLDANVTISIDPQTQNYYYCSEISTTSETSTYFLASRVDDYQDLPRQVFDKHATGMLYTLAAIFLFNTLWAVLELVISGIKIFKKLDQPRLIHALLISITAFMLIRSIYFFILPSGKIISAVSDYVLVVLPTFLYFTCFTIVIVIWYMLVRAYSGSFFKRIQLMIVSINGVLYLLFIIIVLVYHFTQESEKKNDCGGRIPLQPSTTTPQRIVSIVYAVVQAVISLVIGAAFAYLGFTIYLMVKNRKVALDDEKRDKQQKTVSTITLACSIGFMLHCVFVLVLVGAEPSNIVFTFLGLIITEIAPVITLLYSYKQTGITRLKLLYGHVHMKNLAHTSTTSSMSK